MSESEEVRQPVSPIEFDCPHCHGRIRVSFRDLVIVALLPGATMVLGIVLWAQLQAFALALAVAASLMLGKLVARTESSHVVLNSRRGRALGAIAVLVVLWAPPARAGWQVFRVEDGLSDLVVTAIFQGRDEALWFGTRNGLTRYNGIEWTSWTTLDGLSGNEIRAIAGDSTGDLWIATDAGVSRWDGAAFHNFRTADGLVSDDVRAVVADSSGAVWFGTVAGVSRFANGAWTTFDDELPVSDRRINTMLADSAGILWLGGPAGLIRYDGAAWSLVGGTPAILDLDRDAAGQLWLGTESGLERWDGQSLVSFDVPGATFPGAPHVIVSRDGFVWFPGVVLRRYDPVGPLSELAAHLSEFYPPDGPPHGGGGGLCGSCLIPTALFEDRSGNLWVGTAQGLARFDGARWKALTSIEDGAPELGLTAVLEDSHGGLWAGTTTGLWRNDGTGWRNVPEVTGSVQALLEDVDSNVWAGADDGNIDPGGLFRWSRALDQWSPLALEVDPPMAHVRALHRDTAGRIWIGGDAVARYAAGVWTRFGVSDGLIDERVLAIDEDTHGRLWFGTPAGASLFDGAAWSSLTAADGLVGGAVTAILADSPGELWLGTPEGLNRLGPSGWQFFGAGNGLPAHPGVHDLFEDRWDRLWVATDDGVAQFDGARWRTFTESDGLSHHWVNDVSENSRGHLWFATRFRLTRFEPDRVPPQTLIVTTPPPLSTATSINLSYAAAFGELAGITFSTKLDDEPWSAWLPRGVFARFNLLDGVHRFQVLARDGSLNVDVTPAAVSFEIDATPPTPVIESPGFGAVTRDSIVIVGQADDLRFREYRVDYRAVGDTAWLPIRHSLAAVSRGVIGGFETRAHPDGEYELRLLVADTLRLVGGAVNRFVIDNQAPFAAQTTPARVVALTGGDVFTTHSEAHLYVPPHAFDRDALVKLTPLGAGELPAPLPPDVVRALGGYRLEWGAVLLTKSATLDLAAGGSPPASGSRVLYFRPEAGTWSRLGGSFDPASARIAASIAGPGEYAVVEESAGAASGARTLSPLTLTPRVFSPHGGFAQAEIAIGFTLGRSGPAAVRIYNRAGRLVREVTEGTAMGAGANLVRWDGRDRDGGIVVSGVYLVTVEALGETRTQTLAVVK